ncbi:MAG: response regulator [Cyclobacteriaceae bacterium]
MSEKAKYLPWVAKESVKIGNVLAVEDDIAIRAILHNVLKKSFNITVVNNGLEALLWLSKGNTPDLILSDISMPELNGFEFIRSLGQSGVYNSIPVVILSGYDREKIKIQTLEYTNPLSYISKPFDPLKVRDQIIYILQGNHLHVS